MNDKREAVSEPAAVAAVAPGRRDWRWLIALLAPALLIEAVLCWLTSLMWLPKFFPGPAGISLDFVKMLGPDWKRNTLLQVVAFAALFAAFLLALRFLHGRRPSRLELTLLFLAPIAWSATTALLYPPYAVDLFHYVAEGRLTWIYHLNPMVVAPIARPFPIGMSYGDQPSNYGPLWFLLDFPPSLLLPNNSLGEVIVLKLWIAAFYLASGALIYLILRRERKELALFGTALYLWNPFVIIRALGDGHNDVVMFFFVLVALYAILKEDWLAVFPALILAALVKYIPLILAPLVLMYVLRLPEPKRRDAIIKLLIGGGIAVVLAVLIYAPFWAGPATFTELRGWTEQSITSTPLVVELFITDRLYGVSGAAVSRLWMRILFLVPYGLVFLRVRPPSRRLNAAAYQAVWFYVIIATAWFRPWYLLWIVTLGALLPSGWFLMLTLTVSFCGMFPDIVEQYRGYVPWLAADLNRLYLAPIVVAFAPPALVWLAGLLRTRSWFFAADTPSSAEVGSPAMLASD